MKRFNLILFFISLSTTIFCRGQFSTIILEQDPVYTSSAPTTYLNKKGDTMTGNLKVSTIRRKEKWKTISLEF